RAVGPDAVDQRDAVADLVLRDVEHAPLLVEAAGGDLGRMRVDGDRGEALGRRDVAQVTAEALLVDREIVVERQQHGRDDAMGNEVGVTGHFRLLRGPPNGLGTYTIWQPRKSRARSPACLDVYRSPSVRCRDPIDVRRAS